MTGIVNPDGNAVKQYTYDEFGIISQTGTFENEVTFTGSVSDTSTGLQYMNSRFYNPTTGRFLSQDTYSGDPFDPWTQHLYSYCGNNPTNFVDPTGHRPIMGDDVNTERWYVSKAKQEEALEEYREREYKKKVGKSEKRAKGPSNPFEDPETISAEVLAHIQQHLVDNEAARNDLEDFIGLYDCYKAEEISLTDDVDGLSKGENYNRMKKYNADTEYIVTCWNNDGGVQYTYIYFGIYYNDIEIIKPDCLNGPAPPTVYLDEDPETFQDFLDRIGSGACIPR